MTWSYAEIQPVRYQSTKNLLETRLESLMPGLGPEVCAEQATAVSQEGPGRKCRRGGNCRFSLLLPRERLVFGISI